MRSKSVGRAIFLRLIVLLVPLLLGVVVYLHPWAQYVMGFSKGPNSEYGEPWVGPDHPVTVLDIEVIVRQPDMSSAYCSLDYSITAGSNTTVAGMMSFSYSGGGVYYGLPFEPTGNMMPYQERGSVVLYRQLGHSRSWEFPLYESITDTWPFDAYRPPKITLGINGSVAVRRLSVRYQLPTNYVGSIERVDHYSVTDQPIQASFTELNRKYGYEGYYVINLIAIRTESQINLQFSYFFFILYFVYLMAILSFSGLDRLADHAKVLAGVTISVFAFAWSIRTGFFGSVSYLEALLFWIVFGWGMIECLLEAGGRYAKEA